MAAAGITVHGRRCMTAVVGSDHRSDASQPHVPFPFFFESQVLMETKGQIEAMVS